jgi:hypothetical protein
MAKEPEPQEAWWASQGSQPQPVRPRTTGRRWAGAGLVAAGLVAGGVLAGTLGASAASSSSPAGTAAYGSGGPMGSSEAPPAGVPGNGGPRGGNDQGSAPVRGDEKSLSSSLTATLTQKAKAAVPGGTVDRVETDSGDGTYEAHMTKADGSRVTVKFDKSGNVTGVESGMGK